MILVERIFDGKKWDASELPSLVYSIISFFPVSDDHIKYAYIFEDKDTFGVGYTYGDDKKEMLALNPAEYRLVMANTLDRSIVVDNFKDRIYYYNDIGEYTVYSILRKLATSLDLTSEDIPYPNP